MTETKARYLEFCRTGHVPLSLQPWWMDAVCNPECWDVALATDQGGQVIGALPWFKKRRWGLCVVQQPPLTTYSGPWLRYPTEQDFKLQSRYSFEKRAITQLIGQLPKTAFFIQNFRPEIKNWLPFYWENYRQTTRYTYLFDQTTDITTLTAGMKNTLRTDLKKAERAVTCRHDNRAWEAVFHLNAQSFGRKKLPQPFGIDSFKSLHAALHQRDQMACFLACDRANGALHAALYLVADNQQAAVLLTGVHPEYKASCAIYALFLEAIRWCGARGLALDMEGSMQPEIERTFRAMGARQQPYFQVWKAGNRFFEAAYHFLR